MYCVCMCMKLPLILLKEKKKKKKTIHDVHLYGQNKLHERNKNYHFWS